MGLSGKQKKMTARMLIRVPLFVYLIMSFIEWSFAIPDWSGVSRFVGAALVLLLCLTFFGYILSQEEDGA